LETDFFAWCESLLTGEWARFRWRRFSTNRAGAFNLKNGAKDSLILRRPATKKQEGKQQRDRSREIHGRVSAWKLIALGGIKIFVPIRAVVPRTVCSAPPFATRKFPRK
jgi:hypothetical protein